MICHIVCESNVLSSPYNGTNKLLAVKLNISTLDRTTFEQNTTLKKKMLTMNLMILANLKSQMRNYLQNTYQPLSGFVKSSFF